MQKCKFLSGGTDNSKQFPIFVPAYLQGRVRIPTGGIVREPAQRMYYGQGISKARFEDVRS